MAVSGPKAVTSVGPKQVWSRTTVNVEIVCYSEVRKVVGRKRLEREVPSDATVGDLLAALTVEFPKLDPENVGRAGLVVSKNGRNVRHLDGMDTPLDEGCAISLSGSVVAE